jgi:hypothetical protein
MAEADGKDGVLASSHNLANLIVERHPQQNDPRNLIDYTRYDTDAGRRIIERIHELQITPQAYPKAIDLFAGNAGVAEILAMQGWQDITCIDQYDPTESRVPDAKWFNWNLGMLDLVLKMKDELPEEVNALRGKFDLALMVQTHKEADVLAEVAGFFLKPGGVAFLDFTELPKHLEKTGKWTKRVHSWYKMNF